MAFKELQTASNIKDKKTRKNVQKTLNKIIHYLKSLEVPKNGIFIFASYDGL
jgi:peptide subunit release factor 1 (eRF1)